MYYFFDESGNWKGRSDYRLVLGGLIIREKSRLERLKTELNLLLADHKLEYLHANEMSQSALHDCYQIIAKLLENDGNSMLRIYTPNVIWSKSTASKDAIYMDLAANLVSTLIMGDENPSINYDMQFHYAYPENVFKLLKKKKPHHYKKMIRSFELTHDGFEKEGERVIDNYNKLKRNVRNELAVVGKEIEENPKKVVSEYLWSELILQIRGKENTREMFKQKIVSNLQTLSSSFESLEMPQRINVNYFGKDQQNSGIEVIDILCNLVYKHGAEPGQDCPSIVKKIYDNISVEVM